MADRHHRWTPLIGVVLLALIPPDQGLLRAAETIYLVASSPEFAYQR